MIDHGPLAPITQGTDASRTIDLIDDLGKPKRFRSSDVLAARVWGGDDLAPILTPECRWVNATEGRYRVIFAPADTAAVLPGTYRLLVTASFGTAKPKTFEVSRFPLTILAAPGLGVQRPVYCSYDDLLRAAPAVKPLQAEDDQAGFAEDRAEAREWVDGLIQAKHRGGLLPRDDTLDHLLPGYMRRRQGADDPRLQAWLDADRLVRTGPAGRRIVKAAALYAASLIYGRQVTPGEKDGQYATLARRARAEAEALLMTTTAEVDASPAGDGSRLQAIRLGVH